MTGKKEPDVLTSVMSLMATTNERLTSIEKQQKPIYDYLKPKIERAERWGARKEKIIQGVISKAGIAVLAGALSFGITVYNDGFSRAWAGLMSLHFDPSLHTYIDKEGCTVTEELGKPTKRVCRKE